MAIPVRGSGQRLAEGSSVVANKDDRLALGHKARSLVGLTSHFCTERAQRVGSG